MPDQRELDKALADFEARMSKKKLYEWTESEIRSWLTLRERAKELVRRELAGG